MTENLETQRKRLRALAPPDSLIQNLSSGHFLVMLVKFGMMIPIDSHRAFQKCGYPKMDGL